MKVRAQIKDAQFNLIAEEIIGLSDEPLYGRTPKEIESIVSDYVNSWSRKHITISYDIIDPNSGQYPFVDWEKRD